MNTSDSPTDTETVRTVAAERADGTGTRRRDWWARRGPYRVLCWMLSAVAFIAGPAIGMTTNAGLGAAIWLSSALLALVPFASHRHQDLHDGERQQESR